MEEHEREGAVEVKQEISFDDTARTDDLQAVLENTIRPAAQEAVQAILDQVERLSVSEKLLLYLKLPTGRAPSVDSLGQSSNPLGSRSEIQQTVAWVRTHLAEQPAVSLAKEHVYHEYTAFCARQGVKPLSTADFGKVMKQVFPGVRPRRLGTRGHSRYCYAGMDKVIALPTPTLPRLDQIPQDRAGWDATRLVLTWAGELLGADFASVSALARHLVLAKPAPASAKVKLRRLDPRDVSEKKQRLRPRTSTDQEFVDYSTVATPSTTATSCPPSPLSTPQSAFLRSESAFSRPESAFLRSESTFSRLENAFSRPESAFSRSESAFSRSESAFSRPESAFSRPGSAFSRPESAFSRPSSADSLKSAVPALVATPTNDLDRPARKNPGKRSRSLPSPALALASKLPAPRLPKTSAIAPPKVKARRRQSTAGPKMPARKGQKGPALALALALPARRRNEVSVGSLDKDALDDYLVGGGNSPEQEEELMQFFQQERPRLVASRESSSWQRGDEGPSGDKVSQLRRLLERNFTGDAHSCRRVSFEVDPPTVFTPIGSSEEASPFASPFPSPFPSPFASPFPSPCQTPRHVPLHRSLSMSLANDPFVVPSARCYASAPHSPALPRGAWSAEGAWRSQSVPPPLQPPAPAPPTPVPSGFRDFDLHASNRNDLSALFDMLAEADAPFSHLGNAVESKRRAVDDDSQPIVVDGQPLDMMDPSLDINNQLLNINGINGQPMDINGQSMNTSGQPMNINGQPMNINGRPMNINGQPMDINGQSMNINGQPMDINGQPMNTNGRPMNINGRPMNINGRPLAIGEPAMNVNAHLLDLGGPISTLAGQQMDVNVIPYDLAAEQAVGLPRADERIAGEFLPPFPSVAGGRPRVRFYGSLDVGSRPDGL